MLYGRTHSEKIALLFCSQLRAGLFDAAELSMVLAIAAAWRAFRARPAIGLATACCAASVFASSGGLLYLADAAFVRGPFELADRLHATAGPSPGRWRIFTNDKEPVLFRKIELRPGTIAALSDALMPQFNAVAGIEGVAGYFSVADPDYFRAFTEDPEKYFDLFDVRFAIEMPTAFPASFAATHGFRKIEPGYWIKEYPDRPRAFVAGTATRVATVDEAVARIESPGFDLRKQAVLLRGGPPSVEGHTGPARLERPSPERMRVTASGPGVLVVAEHYDPGWRASISPGGEELSVVETDLAALGVVLPKTGTVSVDLRFIPRGLLPGVLLLTLALGGLLAARLTLRAPIQ